MHTVISTRYIEEFHLWLNESSEPGGHVWNAPATNNKSKQANQMSNICFWGEGKTRAPGQNLIGVQKRTNKLSPHMTTRQQTETTSATSVESECFHHHTTTPTLPSWILNFFSVVVSPFVCVATILNGKLLLSRMVEKSSSWLVEHKSKMQHKTRSKDF